MRVTDSEIQVGKEITEKARKSKHFFTVQKDGSGREVFYFRNIGDFILGRLAGRRIVDHNFYSSVHYIIQVYQAVQGSQEIAIGENETREVVAYGDLRRIIDKCELMGSVLRIVMVGRLRTHNGHFRYVWEVYKELGTIDRIEIRQIPKSRKSKKRSDKK